jgi:glycosyltransferase involved in cell wall biosynthesis
MGHPESMAAGRPVVCLDLGGPVLFMTQETAFKIRPESPQQAIDDMAQAMLSLAESPELCRRMSEPGRRRFIEAFTLQSKGELIDRVYRTLANT